MTVPTANHLDKQRAAARRTALLLGGVTVLIFGLFWLAGFLGQ